MPSASGNMDPDAPVDAIELLKGIKIPLEKRSRNLEKRKNRLESYKDELANGKELKEEQLKAVAACDTVTSHLEFCKDLTGQMNDIIDISEEVARQQLKKQQEEKSQQGLDKTKKILRVQAILSRLGQEEVRADFLAGRHGAIVLTEEQLTWLDDVYSLITPSNEPCNPTKFKVEVDTAADHISSLLAGKNKAVGNSTYKELRRIINLIGAAPYPKKKVDTSNTSSTTELAKPPKSKKNKSNKTSPPAEKETAPANQPEISCSDIDSTQVLSNEVPSPVNPSSLVESYQMKLSISEGPPPGINVHPIPQQNDISLVPQNNSTVPSTADHMFYNRFQGQTLEQISAPVAPSLDINDLVASDTFNFLQESQVKLIEQAAVYMDPAVVSFGSIEADGLVQIHNKSPEVNSINTETFINKNFSSSPQSVPSFVAPTNCSPHPIPMPIENEPPQQPTHNSSYAHPQPHAVVTVAEPQSASWAEQSSHLSSSQGEGWGEPETNANITDDNNVWDSSGDKNCTSEINNTRISTWGEEPMESKGYNQQGTDDSSDRRGSFRGRGSNRPRGNNGGGSFMRGGRGGNSFNNYRSDGRNNRGGNGGGFRNRDDNNGSGGFRNRDDNNGSGGFRNRDDNNGSGGFRNRDDNNAGGYRNRDDNNGGGYRGRDNNTGGGYRGRENNGYRGGRGGYYNRNEGTSTGYNNGNPRMNNGYRSRGSYPRNTFQQPQQQQQTQ